MLPSPAVSRRKPPRSVPTSWRVRLAVAAGALLLGLLAVVEVRHRTVAFGTRADRDAPVWIWRDHDLRHVQAAGFYAVKEFDLVAAPAEAEVEILGDSEYILLLNGTRVGSNRFRSGAALDRYRVENLLSPGRNRIVVESRSPTGAGGLRCELRAGGQQLVRSDGSWTLYETNWRGIFGDRPLVPGLPARLLGRSPLGRWGSPSVGSERPTFESVLADPEPVSARRVRSLADGGPFKRSAGRNRRPASYGDLVEFDFGGEVTGYLQLVYREEGGRTSEDPSAVLLRFGDEPVAELPFRADAIFQPIRGAGLYQDAVLRKFRYVAVAALPGVFGAEVLLVQPAAWSALAPSATPDAGILGVPPPPSGATVENEVWRKLERAPRVAVGKAG